MDRAVWQATVYGVAWSWTWLSDYIAAAGKAETKAEHSRTIVQQQSRVLVPPQRTLTIPLSFSAGTKASTQVEDDDFMLSTRFLELHPVTSSPTNQKKVMPSAALTPNGAFKDSSLKAIGSSGLWDWAAPSPPSILCNKRCPFPSHSLEAVNRLCCGTGERIQVRFGNVMSFLKRNLKFYVVKYIISSFYGMLMKILYGDWYYEL